jgi:hypothetical protein
VIFLFSTTSSPALGFIQPPIHSVRGFPEDKVVGRGTDYSLPSSIEEKNGGAILSIPNPSSWFNYAQGQLCLCLYIRRNETVMGSSEITRFRVTKTTNCRVLTRCMNVNYAAGKYKLSFPCIVSIL